jgi:hypothetical protein
VNEHGSAKPAHPSRIACWIADGEGMHPSGELEGFLVDRLGASGDRVAIEPGTTHAVLRILGFANRSVFDPAAMRQVAAATRADWIVWVKAVDRNVKSRKTLGIPYLLNRRRLDAQVFYDVRVYDAAADEVIGSKRLSLTDRGDATWQIGEDERMDPAYNNDVVELHGRMRALDWRAAAAVSRYTAALLRDQAAAAASMAAHTDGSSDD